MPEESADTIGPLAEASKAAINVGAEVVDGHPTDAQSVGHVCVGQQTGLAQPSSLSASSFTLTTGGVTWAPDHGRLLETYVGEPQYLTAACEAALCGKPALSLLPSPADMQQLMYLAA
jgi:hypothetical protein